MAFVVHRLDVLVLLRVDILDRAPFFGRELDRRHTGAFALVRESYAKAHESGRRLRCYAAIGK